MQTHSVTITKGVEHLFAKCTCGTQTYSQSMVAIRRWLDKHGGIDAMQVQRKERKETR